MNRCLFAVVTMLCVQPCQLLLAQTAGEKSFMAYADFVVGGVWVCEIDGQVFEDRYERILDGRFVQLTSKSGEGFPAQTTILGVDPVTQQSSWWGFAADGMVSKGSTRQTEDNIWVGEWRGKGPTGSSRAKGRLTKVDADTIKFEATEQEVTGEAKEFPPVTIWKRKRDADEKLASALIGSWRYVAGQKDGVNLDAEHFEDQSVEITKETFTLASGEKFVMEYEIDQSKSPSVVKFKMIESPFGAGATAAGVLELQDDGTLRLCYAPMGGSPPKAFEAKAGSGYHLFVLRKR